MSKNKSGIWSFFASVQLAVVLLSLIAFFALIGTVVPQREAAAEFGEKLSPTLLTFLQKIQIFDVYHSVWFFLLLTLLSINLIICSWDRFPLAWRRFRRKPAPENDDVFKDLPQENIFQTQRDVRSAADAAWALLNRKYGNASRADEQDRVYLCAQKGKFSLFGVYIVHLSIIVLIAGGMIGAVFGVEGSMNIMEGTVENALHLRKVDQALDLPFAVRCDKFTVELYPNGTPKLFQSDLVFLKGDQEAHAGKLRVNHPIEFEGYRFYQSSYGAVAGGKATVALIGEGGRRDVMNVAQGFDFELPGKEGTFHVLRVESDMMNMGPAIKVTVRSSPKKEESTFWVFQNIDKIRAANPEAVARVSMFNPGSFKPYTFTLLGLEEKYFTSLQVNRDPGTPVVAAAAVLLVCGLMLILFSYARSIFIRIDEKDGRVFVAVAGGSYKNTAGLQKEIQYLAQELHHHLETPK